MIDFSETGCCVRSQLLYCVAMEGGHGQSTSEKKKNKFSVDFQGCETVATLKHSAECGSYSSLPHAAFLLWL